MLLARAIALPTIVSLVACASISSCTQKIQLMIGQALANPQKAALLSPVRKSILHALHQGTGQSIPLLFYICSTNIHKTTSFEEFDRTFWSTFIDSSFGKFCQVRPNEAQALVEHVVIPAHPFLSHLPHYRFDPADFLSVKFQTLDEFFNTTLKTEFDKVWDEAFGGKLDPVSSKTRFYTLITTYKKVASWYSPDIKYSCAFLINLGFEKVAKFSHLKSGTGFYTFIKMSSHDIYYEMFFISSRETNSALESVLPEVYKNHAKKSYADVMRAYKNSQLEPHFVFA